MKTPFAPTSETKNVGIWIRVSTEDQARGESPQHHEQRAREYAKFNGWAVKELYDLSGVSGKTVMDHPEARRMLADIKRGHIKGIIFSKLARLARNTKELLEFADIFRRDNADMISLQEKIDTSSPAGRLFYTIIAAMAQWEREEIADRVKASINIRAKLGKSLGGAAPFGYMWRDNKLLVNPTEAPVRKLMYELFSQQKRMKGVARVLNKMGYRTRKGARFTDTTVLRLLQDTTAKGLYRANHTFRDAKGKLHLKSESEWVSTPVEAIISEDRWNECNQLLAARKAERPLGPKPVHLFAGLLQCGCGQNMYVFSRTSKYICRKCRTKIPMEDMEGIFRDELENFFVSAEKIKAHLASANEFLAEKKARLTAHTQQLEKVRAEMRKTYQIYQADQISPEGFGKIYRPLEEQEKSLASELPKLQGEVDALEMHQSSSEEVVAEAANLHKRWPSFTNPEKRRIIESITEKIVIKGDEIDITLCYMPSSEEVTKRQRNLSDSWPPRA
jgi:site-specific DNA recombinase